MAPEVRGWLVFGGVESCTCGTFCRLQGWMPQLNGQSQIPPWVSCCCLRRRRLKVLAVEEQREIHGLPNLSMLQSIGKHDATGLSALIRYSGKNLRDAPGQSGVRFISSFTFWVAYSDSLGNTSRLRRPFLNWFPVGGGGDGDV
jgi:hypothetical protein